MDSVERGVAQQRKPSRCYQPRQRARRHRSGKRRARPRHRACVASQRRAAADAFVLAARNRTELDGRVRCACHVRRKTDAERPPLSRRCCNARPRPARAHAAAAMQCSPAASWGMPGWCANALEACSHAGAVAGWFEQRGADALDARRRPGAYPQRCVYRSLAEREARRSKYARRGTLTARSSSEPSSLCGTQRSCAASATAGSRRSETTRLPRCG